MLLMPNYIGIHTMTYIDMRIIWPNFTIWFEIKKLMKVVSFLKIIVSKREFFVHSFRRVIALD